MDDTSAKLINDYLRRMLGHDPASPLSEDEINQLQKILTRAEAVRDFEIGLYWTRSTYFWGMQVAMFATFGLLVQGLLSSKSNGADDPTTLVVLFAILIVCAFAAVTSYVWYLMTEGAKYWQDNWERHIDAIEGSVRGPLYRTYFGNDGAFDSSDNLNIISVTRANSFIALLTALMWTALAFLSGVFILAHVSDWLPCPDWLICTLGVALFLIMAGGIADMLRRKLRSGVKAKRVYYDRDASHSIAVREPFRN